ncbi:hypothetical protein [Candidatus Liberibacter sp.]|uniref:hypothetical protein n=1 Tax=Candidatus Liberibacter sp. TaxID=34022 RepID=UPI0015F5A2F2|nr:hypothetical protein [Candidatus Liberibacter sp.]
MVNLVSVIRRAVDSLPENTPDMRSQIYERARSAVVRQLESMKPRPPEEILNRQFSKLEKAILQVERQQQKTIRTVKQESKRALSENSIIDVRNRNSFLHTSRLMTDSPIVKNPDGKSIHSSQKEAVVPSLQERKKSKLSISSRYLSQDLRSILSSSASAKSQRRQDNLILPSGSIGSGLDNLKLSKIKEIASLSISIFFLAKKIFLDAIRIILMSWPLLYERHILRYAVVSSVFLGIFIGTIYLFWYDQGSVAGILIKTAKNEIVGKKKMPGSVRAVQGKITRRLLADGSEIDMDSRPFSENSSSDKTKFLLKSVPRSYGIDSVNVLKSTKSEGKNTIDEKGRSFAKKGNEDPFIILGKVSWSLQKEEKKGSKGSVIRGDISVPENEFLMSLTLKRNPDIALSSTHLMEIVFSFPKGLQGRGIADLQQISMKKTEKEPRILLESNIFRISNDVYRISLKHLPDNPYRNLNILEEYQWIEIPITYQNGRKAVLTLDKGQIGTEIFKTVIQEWKNQP